MPTALVINPNTSAVMTADIRATAQSVFQPPWNCAVVQAPAGPESLESWRDYQLAGLAVLPLLSQHPQVDGVVLACFGDPGLYPLKEISPVPVVGIAEAAISVALLLGGKFGILAGMSRAVGLMDSMVRTYGLESRYAGCASLNLRVLDFGADRAMTLDSLEQTGLSLIKQGADVLLLGCAGLTTFIAEFNQRLPVALVDPVQAGCQALKLLVDAGLQTSHAGLYAQPAAQRMNKLPGIFSPEMSTWLKSWEES